MAIRPGGIACFGLTGLKQRESLPFQYNASYIALAIIQPEFNNHPFNLKAMFGLVSILHIV